MVISTFSYFFFFFFNDTATTEIYTLSLHDALPIFIMGQMLSDDRNRSLAFGRNSDLVIPGHHVAAKTGTTNDFRDNLTVGFMPNLAVAVWVGNADHTPMRNVTGIVGAAPIFHGFMIEALSGQPHGWFAVPAG